MADLHKFLDIIINRGGAATLLVAGLALGIGWMGCGSGATKSGEDSGASSLPFKNLGDDVAFVGDDACFSCHEDEYRGFKRHGMANALYTLTSDNEIENFDDSVVYDTTSGYYYRAYKEDGRYFQEEFRLDENGTRTHSQIREMQTVMGSGISARSYFLQNNGWFYELPISWYTQADTWDFSPGYRKGNKRFDRKITTRCLVCHDAYPDAVPFTDGKFNHIPLGITCERCHGPGELHVDERLAIPEPDSIDFTIVNPAHLSLPRKLDVCQQCHLNSTVQVLREGKTAVDFRPSQDLGDFIALFGLDKPASNEVIGLTSHVGRMKKSACYLESRDLERPLECATCHDPHSSFRDSGPEYFNNTCLTCHAPESLSARLVDSASAPDHVEDSNCISCHMPKRDISRVAHSDFTDHWVRVVGRDDAVSPITSHDPLLLKPIFDADKGGPPNVYTGMAYIIRGRQMRQPDFIQKGIDLLEELLSGGDAYDEAEMILAIGHAQLGDHVSAEPWMENAVKKNPDIPERLNALAQIYESLGRDPSKIENLYKRALSLQPARADIRVNYGRFLDARGQIEDAKRQYRLAIEEEEWLETAYFNLGTALLRSGDVVEAEVQLNRAIDLNPLNGEAWSNLGIMFAGQGKLEAARAAFESGVEADPTSAVALSNLGTHLLTANENGEAIKYLARAFEEDPAYVDAAVNLALAYFRDEQYENARIQAQKVLALDPENALALQILDAI